MLSLKVHKNVATTQDPRIPGVRLKWSKSITYWPTICDCPLEKLSLRDGQEFCCSRGVNGSTLGMERPWI